jgi:hypothetical protein
MIDVAIMFTFDGRFLFEKDVSTVRVISPTVEQEHGMAAINEFHWLCQRLLEQPDLTYVGRGWCYPLSAISQDG